MILKLRKENMLNNLFIIGNGFDLAHGMETSYAHFQNYLRKTYPKADGKKLLIPAGTMMPDGDITYDDVDVVSFLMYIISSAEPNGDMWSDLEESLGRLDFGDCFDTLSPIYDKEGDLDDWKNMYSRQDLARNIEYVCLMITDYFRKWIHTIRIDHKITSKMDFASLIDSDCDYFLNFNYTETLEVIYKVKNVCHIHGKQRGKLIFGHGNRTDYYEENMSRFTGAEDSLQDIHNALQKNTYETIKDHAEFFDEITKCVKDIYSFGFSFSAVDQIYIKKICESLDTCDATWYLNDFDVDDTREKFKKIIRDCGFKGQVITYHIR